MASISLIFNGSDYQICQTGWYVSMAVRDVRLARRFGYLCACLSVIAALATVSACAGGPPDHPIAAQPGPEPNYANPINGVAATIAAASRFLGFHVRELPVPPPPRRILDTPGRPPQLRVVVLQYRMPSGLLDIFEERAGVSVTDFHHVINYWVSQNGKKGTTGTAKRVVLKGNHAALLTIAPGGITSSIEWIEAGVKFDIRGPSLTVRDCIRFANDLASTT